MPEWGFVFFGIICLALILCCAFYLVRKLFGKKRHGEKKQKGLKGFFGGKGPDLVTIDKNKASFLPGDYKLFSRNLLFPQ